MLIVIIVFFLILNILVFVHEFGHFIVAKKSGVKVEEFGFGYPPKIFGKKIGETLYSVNAIPLGGFVRLYGDEQKEAVDLKDHKSFSNKPLSVKALIISAGVAMNIIFAAFIFYFTIGFGGFGSYQNLIFDYQFPFGQQQNCSVVSMVASGSPAEKAGLKPYDVFIEGNGIKLGGSEQFIEFIEENKGKEVVLKIKNLRTEEAKLVNVTPRLDSPQEEGALGIGIGEIAQIQYTGILEKATMGFLHALNLTHYSIAALVHLIKTSFISQSITPLAGAVAGPVGLFAITKLTFDMGIVQLFSLMAYISLALAIANVLPIPLLDGGRLVFILYEFIARKRVPPKIENGINLVGLAFIILLFVLVAYKDVVQFKDILF